MKKIAYFISNFPKSSETFIAREVLLLQNIPTVKLFLFSSKEPDLEEKKKLSDSTKKIISQVTYFVKKKVFLQIIKLPIKFLFFLPLAKNLANDATYNPNAFVLLGRAILLGERCKNMQIEHIHAHWPYASMVAYLTSKIYNLPFSISIHAHEVFHENGHFSKVFPAVKFAAFCNKAALDAMIKNYPESKNKAHLIYHGVNIQNFKISSSPIFKGNTINVISGGRLTKTKGFHRLISACALAQKVTHLVVNLTILGEGKMRSELYELARSLDYENNLEMPGWVSHDRVKKYFQTSHVFALLADVNFHDGLPNVLLEAMALGKLVITSPLPAAPEAITHGINGFILKSVDDYNGFTSILQKLHQFPEVMQEISVEATNTIKGKFEDIVCIKRMVDLFEESEVDKHEILFKKA